MTCWRRIFESSHLYTFDDLDNDFMRTLDASFFLHIINRYNTDSNITGKRHWGWRYHAAYFMYIDLCITERLTLCEKLRLYFHSFERLSIRPWTSMLFS